MASIRVARVAVGVGPSTGKYLRVGRVAVSAGATTAPLLRVGRVAVSSGQGAAARLRVGGARISTGPSSAPPPAALRIARLRVVTSSSMSPWRYFYRRGTTGWEPHTLWTKGAVSGQWEQVTPIPPPLA